MKHIQMKTGDNLIETTLFEWSVTGHSSGDKDSILNREHYENLPRQYTENFFQKQKLKISLEKNDIFNIGAQKIDCEYTLESPR